MDNPFKKILYQEELPEALKDKIMNDISLIKLSIDMADLFAVKYPNVVGSFFTSENDKEQEHNNQG